ncbi:MAG: helix-turn-helix transcriptional regulator [Anaerolineaceae bacterium]
MVTRPTHYNTRYKHDLSPRQQEVLELIARGRTNAEIAERLGVSLDGAKWHVREILSKLNVDSREQAAGYWRNYQRPMSRLARTFAAFSMPGLLKFAVVGGAALGVAGIAVAAVIALRGGGDDGGPLTVAKAPECVVADLDLGMSMYTDDTMHLALTAVAPKPCRFDRAVVFTLQEGSSDPAAIDGNPNSVSVDLTLGPTRSALVAATWSNWCGRRNGFLSVTFPGSDASFHVTDLGSPPCVDPNRPSVLNAVFAPLSSYTFPDPNAPPTATPGQAAARAFADSVAVQVAAGDVTSLLANARGRLYTCASFSPAVCAPYRIGQELEIFHITLHGSEGEDRERPGFEAFVREQLARKLTLVSIGCAVSDALCSQFIVAFQAPTLSNVAYFVFERPAVTGSPQRLIGMGLSGDNADTILNGGITMTNFGETQFTRIR